MRRKPLVAFALLGGVAVGLLIGSSWVWNPSPQISPHWLSEEAVLEHAHVVEATAEYGDTLARLEAVCEKVEVAPDYPPVAAGTTTSESDDDWDLLPRTAFKFEPHYARNSGRVDVNDLFRNVDLNPGDLFIAKGARNHLRELVATRLPVLASLKSALAEVALVELSALVDAGLARGRTYSDYLSSLSKDRRSEVQDLLEKRKVEARARLLRDGASEGQISDYLSRLHVYGGGGELLGFSENQPPVATRRIGDTYYGASVNELPRYSSHRQLLESERLRLAGDIIQFFVSRSTLSSDELARRLQVLESLLESKRGG